MTLPKPSLLFFGAVPVEKLAEKHTIRGIIIYRFQKLALNVWTRRGAALLWVTSYCVSAGSFLFCIGLTMLAGRQVVLQ